MEKKQSGGDSAEHISLQRGERKNELWPGVNTTFLYSTKCTDCNVSVSQKADIEWQVKGIYLGVGS